MSEAGASVYSASAFASKELPDLDVTLRGAVSIARRLQDPLAELVKIDPKTIGVGQYQHDVNQGKLAQSLDAVVEDCVNAVGVDLNTASAPLLARVSGLDRRAGRQHRRATATPTAPSATRQQLMEVPRLGAKTFEQAPASCASAAATTRSTPPACTPRPTRWSSASSPRPGRPSAGADRQHRQLLRALQAATSSPTRGSALPTVKDILRELEKPGRDPRPEFKTATFTDGVEKLKDLEPGMVLEGVVTNVTDVRRLRRHRRAPGRPGARVGHVATSSSRTRTRWSRPATW